MLSQFLVCVMAFGGIDDFQALPGGVVVVDGRLWPSLTDWHNSEAFERLGGRCDVRPPSRGGGDRGSGCGQFETDVSNDFDLGGTQTIPVVFHIITLDDATNIEDCTGYVSPAVVQQQIDVIAEDFGGESGAGAAVTQLSFSLAGISYTRNDTWHSQAESYETEYKEALNVDPEHYINVYVNSAAGYLGWAYFPYGGMAGSSQDGIVIAFDSVPGSGGAFGLGRTLTHELGHYLSLYHTFGETWGDYVCPDPRYSCYTTGDLICDTYPEEEPSSGCTDQATCGDPDSIHNFLNYTHDSCMTEFTDEQAIRLRCTLTTYRSSLLEAAPEIGPCCTDESCIIMDAADCTAVDGDWGGADKTCDDVDCSSSAERACCTDGSCTMMDVNDCEIADGKSGGAFETCDDVDCSSTEERPCCLEGMCLGSMTEEYCDFMAGYWRGADETCDDLDCSRTSCCIDGSCSGEYSVNQCESWAGGTPGMPGDTCADADCSAAACTGDGDSDGSIGFLDLVGLTQAFGGTDATYDMDASGVIDVRDLIQLLHAWGPC